MHKRRMAFFAGLMILSTLLLTGCAELPQLVQLVEEQASEFISQSEAIETEPQNYLVSPFRDADGKGDWYLTQSFGAYLESQGGSHYGEDWNRASGDGEVTNGNIEYVYPIAPGEVVYSGYTKSYGGYIVIRQDDKYTVPASEGPHLFSAVQTNNDSGRGSRGEGAYIAYSKDVFSSGTLIDNRFKDERKYQYDSVPKATIYSVYLHVTPLLEKKERINWENMDQPVAQLCDIPAAGMFAHLHFEIRVSLPDEGDLFPDYFTDSQKMIDLGYREPSSVIQANMQSSNAMEKPNQVPMVEGTEQVQQPGEESTVIISLNPNGAGAADFIYTAATPDAYVMEQTNGGYRLSCSVLECITISADDLGRIILGESIDTPMGKIGQAESGLAYPDLFYGMDEAIVFNQGRYAIDKVPQGNVPELLRDPSQDIWYGAGWSYSPVVTGTTQQTYFISKDAVVTMFDYVNGTPVRFEDFLNSGNPVIGEVYWPDTFFATIRNNEIISLTEIFASIDV